MCYVHATCMGTCRSTPPPPPPFSPSPIAVWCISLNIVSKPPPYHLHVTLCAWPIRPRVMASDMQRYLSHVCALIFTTPSHDVIEEAQCKALSHTVLKGQKVLLVVWVSNSNSYHITKPPSSMLLDGGFCVLEKGRLSAPAVLRCCQK